MISNKHKCTRSRTPIIQTFVVFDRTPQSLVITKSKFNERVLESSCTVLFNSDETSEPIGDTKISLISWLLLVRDKIKITCWGHKSRKTLNSLSEQSKFFLVIYIYNDTVVDFCCGGWTRVYIRAFEMVRANCTLLLKLFRF